MWSLNTKCDTEYLTHTEYKSEQCSIHLSAVLCPRPASVLSDMFQKIVDNIQIARPLSQKSVMGFNQMSERAPSNASDE